MTQAPLAILAGNGDIAKAVYEAAEASGRFVYVFGLTEQAMEWAPAHASCRLGFGEVGKLTATLKSHNIAEVCLIGAIVRPDLRSVRFDMGGVAALPKLLKQGFGGDDALLRIVVSLIEGRGCRVVSAQHIAPHLLLPSGFNAGAKPHADFAADLGVAKQTLQALAGLDIGQAMVIIRGQVVALEAAEGTNGLLQRVAEMRASRRIKVPMGEGLFVKALKPEQDSRVDVPAFGLETLQAMQKAGLASAALQAQGVIAADWQAVSAFAAQSKLHVSSFEIGNAS